MHPHRGRAPAYPAQAGTGGGGFFFFFSCRRRDGGGRRQDQALALFHHEDGGLRGTEGQVHVFHGGDGRGEGDRLSVPAGPRLERRDHAATRALQKPAGHPGGQVDPAEAAAPSPAARAPPPQRLQLRLDGHPRQVLALPASRLVPAVAGLGLGRVGRRRLLPPPLKLSPRRRELPTKQTSEARRQLEPSFVLQKRPPLLCGSCFREGETPTHQDQFYCDLPRVGAFLHVTQYVCRGT